MKTISYHLERACDLQEVKISYLNYFSSQKFEKNKRIKKIIFHSKEKKFPFLYLFFYEIGHYQEMIQMVELPLVDAEQSDRESLRVVSPDASLVDLRSYALKRVICQSEKNVMLRFMSLVDEAEEPSFLEASSKRIRFILKRESDTVALLPFAWFEGVLKN